MNKAKPVKCQKCGQLLDYVTMLAKGLRFQEPLKNVKLVAICIEYFQRKK